MIISGYADQAHGFEISQRALTTFLRDRRAVTVDLHGIVTLVYGLSRDQARVRTLCAVDQIGKQIPEGRIPHNLVCHLRYRSAPRPLVQQRLSPQPRHWSSRYGNFVRAGSRSPARCRSASAHYERPVCRCIFACINGRFSGNAEVSNMSHLWHRGRPVEACEHVPDLAINDAVAAHRAI